MNAIKYCEGKARKTEEIFKWGRAIAPFIKESPMDVPEGTCLIVTFVKSSDIDLKAKGIARDQAEVLRASLSTFTDDWDSPEMRSALDIYLRKIQEALEQRGVDVSIPEAIKITESFRYLNP